MDIEANENIEKLLAPHSSEVWQRAAVTRLAEMLEESYILDLPPSRPILDALETFAGKKDAPEELTRRAMKVHNKYKID